MKNSKGISLTSLVIMIIVIIILSSIVFVISNDGMEMSEQARYKNEIKELQTAITSRFSGYCRNEVAFPLEGTAIDISDGDTADQITEKIINALIASGRYAHSIDMTEENVMPAKIKKFVEDNIDNISYTRILNPQDWIAIGLNSVSGNANYSYIVNYYSTDVIGPVI